MIVPLPDQFPTKALRNFTIGEVEPSEDELLLPCFCDIPPIERFLQTNKSILLGGKGTGKTALLTLLKRGERSFANPLHAKQRLIPVYSDMEYSRLKYAVLATIKSDIPDTDIQFRYLWEIYILYRILVELRDDGVLSDHRIREDASRFLEIFDPKEKSPSLLDFLGLIKKTAGIRLDTTNPAFPAPDFYLSIEPSENTSTDKERLDVSLASLKGAINRFLRRKKQYVYVIVDNIDDFVSREQYEIQKLLLQGLIQCSRSFSGSSNIKIKLLLRADLFEHINFAQVGGYDKVSPTTVKLEWTPSDIWHFLGERVLWNLKHQLGVDEFGWVGDGHKLNIEPWRKREPWYAKFLKLFRISRVRPRDERDGRDISSSDEVYKSAIATIFPRNIDHYDEAGNVQEIDFFDFIESHFKLGNGELTPRLLMIYAQKVFEMCADYYEKNPDNLVKLDENGEYPLLKRREILEAYGWLQDEVLRVFLGTVTIDEWRDWLEILFRQKRRKKTFSYRAVRKLLGVPDKVRIDDFLAYMCHLGVFNCRDSSIVLEQRHYELPILLQMNYSHS